MFHLCVQFSVEIRCVFDTKKHKIYLLKCMSSLAFGYGKNSAFLYTAKDMYKPCTGKYFPPLLSNCFTIRSASACQIHTYG